MLIAEFLNIIYSITNPSVCYSMLIKPNLILNVRHVSYRETFRTCQVLFLFGHLSPCHYA